jgi:hypothetical protein
LFAFKAGKYVYLTAKVNSNDFSSLSRTLFSQTLFHKRCFLGRCFLDWWGASRHNLRFSQSLSASASGSEAGVCGTCRQLDARALGVKVPYRPDTGLVMGLVSAG